MTSVRGSAISKLYHAVTFRDYRESPVNCSAVNILPVGPGTVCLNMRFMTICRGRRRRRRHHHHLISRQSFTTIFLIIVIITIIKSSPTQIDHPPPFFLGSERTQLYHVVTEPPHISRVQSLDRPRHVPIDRIQRTASRCARAVGRSWRFRRAAFLC